MANSVASIDGAQLQRLKDIARGEQLGGYAQLVHDLRAEPEEAHFQALEVLDRLDLLAEPAGRFGGRHGAGDGVDPVLAEHLVHQLDPAAVAHPCQVLAQPRAEGNAGEHGERRVRAGEEAGGRPGSVHRATRDRLDRFQRWNDGSRLMELELECPARGTQHPLRELRRGFADQREAAGESAGQVEANLLGRCGRREHQRRQAGQGNNDAKLAHSLFPRQVESCAGSHPPGATRITGAPVAVVQSGRRSMRCVE